MNDKHIVQLDGLRFFAVLMVMFAHWMQWQWTNPFLTRIPFVHGVTLFFVLSGYLITNILLTNKEKYNAIGKKKAGLIKNFYIRRFFRIFPIYYLLIFLLFIFNYKNTREMFPWLVSYSSNIYQSINNVYIGDFNHFWSLCVEEQFYLFWPFVILFSRPKKTLSIIIITIIISLIIRLFFFLYIEKWMATSYFTLNCMHALGLGALLSYIKLYKPKTSKALTKSKWLVIIASLYICSLLFKRPLNLAWYKDTIDEFFFAVVAFFIIAIASENGFKGIFKFILENKFIKYSGQISYGLYVYHLFIPELYFFISPRIGLGISNKYTFFVVMYFLTFLVAHISWKLIESPINKFKDKVPYLKSAHE